LSTNLAQSIVQSLAGEEELGMDRVQKALVANIKRIRKLMGYSQMKLAEMCGLSTGFIAEIETAKKFPSSGSIERIAQALSLRPYQLFLDGEDQNKLDVPRTVARLTKELKKLVSDQIDDTANKLTNEINR
jgi:transcriptional regulator with XRE-family HTH domain